MIGRLKEMYRSRDGKGWIISFYTEKKINGDRFDKLSQVDCDISIKQHREVRSPNQNAYFHVLVNQIAEETGESDEDVKVRLVTSYGALKKMDNGKYMMWILPKEADATEFYKYAVLFDQRTVNGTVCNMWKVYKDTHKMDTKEMARLIDGAIAEAKELGIDTDTPEEKARLKKQQAQYDAAHKKKGD